MKRRPTTQDISWFLDLNTKGQLDLDPPYQRRSVWTPKDRRFFLDTVLRDFPTGPVFLHKTTDEGGKSTFHVVDGKQRLQTIIMFSQDDIRAPQDFGDARINNKRFSELPKDAKDQFWNYILTVEMLPTSEGATVNQIFDRLNRNSRKLTRQELRHARFEGAFCTFVEAEAEHPLWNTFGIATTARTRRMRDVEFVADLFLLVMHGVISSDPDRLDDYFAEYDDEIPDFKSHVKRFEWAKRQLTDLDGELPLAESRFSNFADFYGLFAAVLRMGTKGIDSKQTAKAVRAFVKLAEDPNTKNADAIAYAHAVRGASNDAKERNERIRILFARLVKHK